jgi:hypothetical protein
MNQDQAISIIDDAVSQLKLTRQDHEKLRLAITIVREVAKRFSELMIAQENAAKAAKTPDPKLPVDNEDKSQA